MTNDKGRPMTGETEDKLAREAAEFLNKNYKFNPGTCMFEAWQVIDALTKFGLELTEQRGGTSAKEWLKGYKFSFGRIAESDIPEIAKVCEAYASSRLADADKKLQDWKAYYRENLEAENATLRAELERLTKLIEDVKQEITEEPTIGRTVELLFREPLEKAEVENRELKQELARLTGERDAAHHERETKCDCCQQSGCQDGCRCDRLEKRVR